MCDVNIKVQLYLEFNDKKKFWMMQFPCCSKYMMDCDPTLKLQGKLNDCGMFDLMVEKLHGNNDLFYIYNTFLISNIKLDILCLRYISLLPEYGILLLGIICV